MKVQLAPSLDFKIHKTSHKTSVVSSRIWSNHYLFLMYNLAHEYMVNVKMSFKYDLVAL